MNGLKHIRIRCNFSLSELADTIGVTRQALSAWENGKKDIPDQRREQLSEFFGVDKEYFGEISEEKEKYLLEKAMFRYDNNGKEIYRYKVPDGITGSDHTPVCFLNDRKMTLDEEFVSAQRKKQEILEKAADIIKWTDHAGSIRSQMACINRGCTVYGMINSMMEEMRGMRPDLKMPFFFELINVFKSMLLAYDLIGKNEISYLDKTRYHCGEDGEWILQLSQQIKLHWEEELDYFEKQQKPASEQTQRQEEKSINEQIAEAEEFNRAFMREQNDKSRIKELVVYMN